MDGVEVGIDGRTQRESGQPLEQNQTVRRERESTSCQQDLCIGLLDWKQV